MKLNATSLLLLGILGFVGFMLLKPMLSEKAQVSKAGSPNSDNAKVENQDVLGSIVGAVNGIFGAIQAVSQSQPKTQ